MQSNDPILLNAIAAYDLYFDKPLPVHYTQLNSPDLLLKQLTEALVKGQPIPEVEAHPHFPDTVGERPLLDLDKEDREQFRQKFLEQLASQAR